jgi:hypothetical protein
MSFYEDATPNAQLRATIIRGGADPLLEETPHKRTMIRAAEAIFSEEAGDYHRAHDDPKDGTRRHRG